MISTLIAKLKTLWAALITKLTGKVVAKIDADVKDAEAKVIDAVDSIVTPKAS